MTTKMNSSISWPLNSFVSSLTIILSLAIHTLEMAIIKNWNPSVISINSASYSPPSPSGFPADCLQYPDYKKSPWPPQDIHWFYYLFPVLHHLHGDHISFSIWLKFHGLSLWPLPCMSPLLPHFFRPSLYLPGKALWPDLFKLLACSAPIPTMVQLRMAAKKHNVTDRSQLKLMTVNFKWVLSATRKYLSLSLVYSISILLDKYFISFWIFKPLIPPLFLALAGDIASYSLRKQKHSESNFHKLLLPHSLTSLHLSLILRPLSGMWRTFPGSYERSTHSFHLLKDIFHVMLPLFCIINFLLNTLSCYYFSYLKE